MKVRKSIKIGIILTATSLFVYARWVEPRWIEVTHHHIQANIERPFKIVQLSDLHTYEFGPRETKVLDILHAENPDVILISGDTISNGGDWKSVGILLKQLRAPFGVFIVRGNWEHWRPDPAELKTYQDSNVIFLNNEAQSLSANIWVVGIDDALSGEPDKRKAFKNVPPEAFRIALFHSPSYFDSLDDQRVDLGLAGHTHGGQIRLPFLPPFWLPEGSGNYVESWYTRGSNRMYVSRGVGNSILEFRFACRPEISVFYLEPKRFPQ